MIPVFTSKELSRRLEVPLAKWKRWSREFLPPDPLAGQQSGYTRQYYMDAAFTVFLGGTMVSQLGIAIPTARQILAQLEPWRKQQGHYFDLRGNLSGSVKPALPSRETDLWIYLGGTETIRCIAKTVVEASQVQQQAETLTRLMVRQQSIGAGDPPEALADTTCIRVLAISKLLRHFVGRLRV